MRSGKQDCEEIIVSGKWGWDLVWPSVSMG